MARKTVKKTVEEIRKQNPNARIDVLYSPNAWCGGHSSKDVLPESEWKSYRVNSVEWYGDNLCIIDAS